MKTQPTLDELRFIPAACFPCGEEKIQRFTSKLIAAHESSRTLLDELKKADKADKAVLYNEAKTLNRDFCQFIKTSGLVLTWMTANKHPDSEQIAKVVLKVFEHLLFLKQLDNGNFTIRAANQSS